jgi:AbrB family looped-hinge helix DNA binding protein
MNSLISEKGQVTIPKKLRKQLGLTPGTVLKFCEQNGKLVGEKKVDVSPFDEWVGKGKLSFGASANSYLKQIRGRRSQPSTVL